MTAKEMFNELTWISDSWDGEHISFDKNRLEGYLQELETKLQNTPSNSDYAKCKIEAEIKRLEDNPEGDYVTRISALEWTLRIFAER